MNELSDICQTKKELIIVKFDVYDISVNSST